MYVMLRSYLVPPPQKIAIMRCTIFPQVWHCWRSAQFLPYSAIFAQLLLNCPLDGMDQPVMANATTVILMEKGIDATRSRQFAIVQSPGIYCRNMQSSTVPETDTRHRSFLHPRAAPVSPVSCYRKDTTARHRFRSGKLLYVTNSPGSRKSLLFVTALYLLHTHRISHYRTHLYVR